MLCYKTDVTAWTERVRKFEEEEQARKLAAEQAAAEQAAEMNAEKQDDAQQLFDKPGLHWDTVQFINFLEWHK